MAIQPKGCHKGQDFLTSTSSAVILLHTLSRLAGELSAFLAKNTKGLLYNINS
ncbi:MAG: hypothetical protein HUU54_17080 [Ignavibacteriaceae bacterium]|nr:hypothetical protein [Ignavibacteriaceae bacterium]